MTSAPLRNANRTLRTVAIRGAVKTPACSIPGLARGLLFP
jgi:hypothetical protein